MQSLMPVEYEQIHQRFERDLDFRRESANESMENQRKDIYVEYRRYKNQGIY